MTDKLQYRLGDEDCPTSIEKAVPVDAVPQEYAYMQSLQCTCGRAGVFEPESQALMQHEGSQFDQIACKCGACGEKCTLFFNVDAVFAGYKRLFGGSSSSDDG